MEDYGLAGFNQKPATTPADTTSTGHQVPEISRRISEDLVLEVLLKREKKLGTVPNTCLGAY